MQEAPRVGIIGAGISGLRCADLLIQNGAQVTILEARDRIGGRIAQTEFDGHIVDLGPNWIHGCQDNPVEQISALTNTPTYEWDGREAIIDKDGKAVDLDVATKLIDWVWTTIENAFRYSTKNKDSIPAEESLLDFVRREVDASDFTDQEKEISLEFSKLWGAYVGDGSSRQSLKFFCLEQCIDGTNLIVASNYKDILAHIAKPVLVKADVRLNDAMVKIEAPIREPGGYQKITVTTKSGKQHEFDEILVTCPLGWLQKNKSVFNPEIDRRLSLAFDNISYGRLEKIYVNFPRAYWHTTTEVHVNGNAVEIEQKTESLNDKAADTPPAGVQFLSPAYVDVPEGIEWNQQCISLAALPPPYDRPTLLFYTYGDCGSYVVSHISKLEKHSEAYNKFLTDFLSPYYSKLPNYSTSSPDCQPTGFLATEWQNDEYAGYGSYSNFQVGLQHGDEDIEVMRAGMGAERGVWFAGEHTAPFVGLGTTTGSYWSGERAAGQICDRYNLGKVEVKDDSLPTS